MTEEPPLNSGDINRRMARGALWMIAMRWVIRAIGLINTIILARLLVPEDFGIVAMATVVIGLLEFLIEFRADVALLRLNTKKPAYYNSAWTLQIMTSGVAAVLIVAIAPIVGHYYGDDRVEIVMYIIALRPAIEGFENIGQIHFRQELKFDKEFRYWIYRRLVSFVLGLIIIISLRNYLALAIHAPVAALSTVALSYVMSSYRPRLSTQHIGEIWSISKWIVLASVPRFFGSRGEEFILGGVTTPQTVGAYYVGADVSNLLIGELVLPANRALTPSYAKLSHDPKELSKAFEITFAALSTLSISAGIGASLVAENFITVLLGPKWQLAIPIFQWLALHSAFWCAVQCMQPYFLISGREKLFSICNIAYLAVIIPVLVMAGQSLDIELMAFSRMVVSACFLVGMLALLAALKVFSVSMIWAMFWRPTAAAVLMIVSVRSVDLHTYDIIELAAQVATGALVFAATQMLLWRLSGRPDGIESRIAAMIANRFGGVGAPPARP